MTVVSVLKIDDQNALWTFSAEVLIVSNFAGLLIGGQEPDSINEITPEGWLSVFYSMGVFVDDVWGIDAVPPVAITFAGGGTLALPQSGTVV